jgi:hypothetical protein
VRFRFAAFAALRMVLLAAARCFALAIGSSSSNDSRHERERPHYGVPFCRQNQSRTSDDSAQSGMVKKNLGRNPRKKCPKKQKARLATGLRREKSFWANARMARETLLQSGVYERSANQSRKKTAALAYYQV